MSDCEGDRGALLTVKPPHRRLSLPRIWHFRPSGSTASPNLAVSAMGGWVTLPSRSEQLRAASANRTERKPLSVEGAMGTLNITSRATQPSLPAPGTSGIGVVRCFCGVSSPRALSGRRPSRVIVRDPPDGSVAPALAFSTPPAAPGRFTSV
jgi:hypothetical protein